MKKISLLLLAAIISVSCAHRSNKKDIQEKADQSTVTTPNALGGTIHDAIHSSKSLTEAQKLQLEGIIAANKKKADELTAESFKFRGILIQELLSEKSDRAKVKLIKKNIKRIESAKLKNTFETVEKISEVVSKNPDRQDFSDHLLNIERPLR